MKTGKGIQTLRADNRVADVENEGLEAGRFFVHLATSWRYTSDGSNDAPVRTRSFSRVAEALKAVRASVAVVTCCSVPLSDAAGKCGCANCNGDNATR